MVEDMDVFYLRDNIMQTITLQDSCESEFPYKEN